MAKQLGVIQFRGKLGDIVGAKKSASQSGNTLRVRNRVIANPKTRQQASQRMKMTPACNFYRALQRILNHSWQGVKYEGPSHNKFMQLALKMSSGFPYVSKGSVNPVPGSYPISLGSLAPISVTYGEDNLFYGINLGNVAFTNDSTVGFISTQILANNGTLAEGDQLTFILCIGQPGYYFSYRAARFVLDTKSSATFGQWLGAEWPSSVDPLGFATQGDGDDKFLSVDAGAIAATAVIVSRPPVSKSGAWQRSSTYLTVREDVYQYYGSQSALSSALLSYQNAQAAYSSDWYLNQGNAGATSDSGASVVTLQTVLGPTAFYAESASSVRLILHQYSNTANQSALGRWFAFKLSGAQSLQIISQGNGYETADDAISALGAQSYITLTSFLNYMPDFTAEDTFSSGANQGGNGGSVEEQP